MAKAKTQSNGTCQLCGQEFSKGTISRHLAKCCEMHEEQRAADGKKKAVGILRLAVEGRYSPEYWLHVEVAADSKFADLDLFLRDIWLECCGHLSDFRFPQEEKERKAQRKQALAAIRDENDAMELFNIFAGFDPDQMERENDATMAGKIGGRVKVGDVFDYEYDFGSTTALKLKVVGQREGKLKRGEVRLLARNLPPDIRCKCGKPAIWVCTECAYDIDGWLCKACAKKHPCGDEMFLPVVNSPRVGVCAYCGPDSGDGRSLREQRDD
jgi:hypothetical protein